MLIVCDDLVEALNEYLKNPYPIEGDFKGTEIHYRVIINLKDLGVKFNEN